MILQLISQICVRQHQPIQRPSASIYLHIETQHTRCDIGSLTNHLEEILVGLIDAASNTQILPRESEGANLGIRTDRLRISDTIKSLCTKDNFSRNGTPYLMPLSDKPLRNDNILHTNVFCSST